MSVKLISENENEVVLYSSGAYFRITLNGVYKNGIYIGQILHYIECCAIPRNYPLASKARKFYQNYLESFQ